ncbi:MAG: DUF3575 domain-containing protein [Flavobacteriales bacterium]|nr:DUF3575 domain-containing protein [Flavobacteriales bacterium]
MKTSTRFLCITAALVIGPTNQLNAQNDAGPDARKQAISVCALAIPLMNLYVINYEYLYQDRHGLAARLEYAPNLKGENTRGDALGGVLNYRWHLSPKLSGFFVGPYARYRYVYGSGSVEGTEYDFEVPELNVGVNGGYRWVAKCGFNVVLAAGYGYSSAKERLTPSNDAVIDGFNAFKDADDANSSMLDAPFYGEFSIGYAF